MKISIPSEMPAQQTNHNLYIFFRFYRIVHFTGFIPKSSSGTIIFSHAVFLLETGHSFHVYNADEGEKQIVIFYDQIFLRIFSILQTKISYNCTFSHTLSIIARAKIFAT